ncbi:hypothetical protein B0O99DRAFT_644117 [Bisporella sp. PMI_857]|nr:hypothetical protein B0O99DRAFT_644117 [Bisporella sp. PMI_857]
MTNLKTKIDALDNSDASKATLQTQLTNFQNGPYGKASHYSFSFNTNLALAGGSPIGFKRSLSKRGSACSVVQSSSSSNTDSQTGSISSVSSGSRSRSTNLLTTWKNSTQSLPTSTTTSSSSPLHTTSNSQPTTSPKTRGSSPTRATSSTKSSSSFGATTSSLTKRAAVPDITITTPPATPGCVHGLQTYSIRAVVSTPANAASVKLIIPGAGVIDSDWELQFLPGKDSDPGKDVVSSYQIGINSTEPPIKTGNGSEKLTISWRTPAGGRMLISVF